MAEETEAVAAIADSSGQDLIDVANQSWNSNRAEYSGIYYRLAVNNAMRQDVPEKHKKRKIRREEAATTVAHIFDQARKTDPAKLTEVANDAVAKNDEGALKDFASEVAGVVQATENHAGGMGVLDPISLITLIMSIVQSIVPLFQQCKKPTPTPVPTPDPVTP